MFTQLRSYARRVGQETTMAVDGVGAKIDVGGMQKPAQLKESAADALVHTRVLGNGVRASSLAYDGSETARGATTAV